MECYYCDDTLTNENESIEHIIPNAIGGRLKSKKLLCKKCNSLLGEKYDSELCHSLSTVAGFLDIEREKGENPTIKNVRSKSGEKYNLIKGRHPEMASPVVNLDKDNNTVHISARNEKELKTIIKGLKKKYPNLDDADLEKKFIRQKYYMDEALTMTMQVGSREFLKAVIKIAVNYYLHKTSDKNTILQRIEDLKSDKEIGVEMVRHYYTNESVNYITPEEVSHTIYVKGDKKSKYLFAFVELFSSYAFIVSLNSDYAGNDFASSYTYDVLTCNEIEKHIQIDYKGKLDESNPDLNSQFIKTLTKKINRAMAIGDKRQTDAIISEITKVAMKETIGKYPEGTIITEPMMNEFFNKVSQDAALFIAHLHKKRGRQSS
jgi:hypothetical protein